MSDAASPGIVDFDHRTSGIDGLVVLTMKQVTDERGSIREFFRASAFETAGLGPGGPFRQINLTETRRGAVRGLHAEDMTKLVAVVVGEALGVYVDLRPTASSFGAIETVRLLPGTQVLVPRGVANGFQAIAEGTQYVYCFDDEWRPGMSGTACTPLDQELGVEWPIPIDPDDASQISAKDRGLPTRAAVMATMMEVARAETTADVAEEMVAEGRAATGAAAPSEVDT